MTLLRELIDIPTSVSEGDFVVKAAEGADLDRYVVTDQLRDNFADALRKVGHAVTTGRSQAAFLHGSFGSGKSHFMAVLREVLRHNPAAREIRGLAEPVVAAEPWLPGKKFLTLTLHMLDARSVEQAVLEGYLRQITAAHPEAPVPAVHRSDALLDDAAGLRRTLGDDRFFAALREAGTGPGAAGTGLAALKARSEGWTPQRYAEAAAQRPRYGRPGRAGQRPDLDLLHQLRAQRGIPRPGYRPRRDHPARQGARLRLLRAVPRRDDPLAVHEAQ